MFLGSLVQVGTVKPEFEVADVFRQFESEYRRRYPVTWMQRRVIGNIVRCRTAALGGYIEECDTCGRLRICYCS